MNVIHASSAPSAGFGKVSAAIGMFDGVHLGHQQVIRQTLADAEQQEAQAVVITFDCHPNRVVAPGREPPLIYPLAKKLRTIETLGADTTLLIHFDEAFSRQSGEAFVRGLAARLGPLHSICVGSNFTFGHKRSGNVGLLKQLGDELKFIVHGLAAISLDGQPVSSTRIREAIRQGQFDEAGQMLGRAYSLFGPVLRGDQLGRQLGFPTANLDTTDLVLPPCGVYAVHAHVQGKSHRAVLNIGHRPTVKKPSRELRVEAHLLDFSGDLYGQDLEISFVQKLRDEQQFPSLAALQAQIQRDIAAARGCFGPTA
jgi:riboflavin kinase/FMN adenylyltransferase